MKKLLTIALAGSLTAFATSCSSGGEENRSATTANINSNAPPSAPTSSPATRTDSPAAGSHSGATSGDVPASVRAVFPDAQQVTTQHKDLSASQVSTIEKETNTKIADKDHHSYLAFSTAGGTRRQTGAATVVNANGKEMVVVYESRNGVPYIKEVSADGVPQTFLDQFKGMGHDDKFQIGGDLKASGVDDATARAAAATIRQDAVIMQTLYGGKHSH